MEVGQAQSSNSHLSELSIKLAVVPKTALILTLMNHGVEQLCFDSKSGNIFNSKSSGPMILEASCRVETSPTHVDGCLGLKLSNIESKLGKLAQTHNIRLLDLSLPVQSFNS